MDIDSTFDFLIKQLAEAGLAGKPNQHGLPAHVRMWVRHNFRCAYCGCDLLNDLNSFYSAQLDHLLPVAQYEELKDIEDNWILSCFVCNHIKHSFDPVQYSNIPHSVAVTADILKENKETLIDICRKHLDSRRKEREDLRKRIKGMISTTTTDN